MKENSYKLVKGIYYDIISRIPPGIIFVLFIMFNYFDYEFFAEGSLLYEFVTEKWFGGITILLFLMLMAYLAGIILTGIGAMFGFIVTGIVSSMKFKLLRKFPNDRRVPAISCSDMTLSEEIQNMKGFSGYIKLDRKIHEFIKVANPDAADTVKRMRAEMALTNSSIVVFLFILLNLLYANYINGAVTTWNFALVYALLAISVVTSFHRCNSYISAQFVLMNNK